MEPDKFEKHIKEKLREREIKPSAAAWDKISEELTTAPKTKSPNRFWYAVAASVIVLISVSLFYFSGNDAKTTEEIKMVNTPEQALPKERQGDVGTVIKNATEIVVTDTEQDIDKTVLEDEVIAEGQSRTNEVKDVKKEYIEEGEIVNKEALAMEETKEPIIVPEAVLHIKIAEVVAQVNHLERSEKVTDAEVDSLLYAARTSILKEKLFNTDNSVNALALLNEVEGELDQSFRDQIFESLKAGFLKVRTAVADRNN
ncbi:hypothetical protein [Maribacter sp. 2210JD10-5]|uniref:hypothetical protein n=1 Tax=Maribacter sp. 2210JD10-5 TaxID=3386272 RepID=UPI0039BD29E6